MFTHRFEQNDAALRDIRFLFVHFGLQNGGGGEVWGWGYMHLYNIYTYIYVGNVVGYTFGFCAKRFSVIFSLCNFKRVFSVGNTIFIKGFSCAFYI